jgi:hypothetical protein
LEDKLERAIALSNSRDLLLLYNLATCLSKSEATGKPYIPGRKSHKVAQAILEQ